MATVIPPLVIHDAGVRTSLNGAHFLQRANASSVLVIGIDDPSRWTSAALLSSNVTQFSRNFGELVTVWPASAASLGPLATGDRFWFCAQASDDKTTIVVQALTDDGRTSGQATFKFLHVDACHEGAH